MRGKSFRKKVSSAQVTPPSYPTGVGKGARVVVGSNRSDRAALHPKAEIRGNTAASDRQSRSIAAPAAVARDDRRNIEVEGLADAGFDAAVGGAAADDDRVAPQHVQQLGDARSVEGARPALQKYIILGPRRDRVGEPGLRRALDA